MSIRDILAYFETLLRAADTTVSYARKWAADIESEELASIVVRHACTAAVTGMGAGVLPGIGALISGGISVGAIWHMYYAVGKYLRIGFNVDMLKAAAAAILSNIVNQLWGVLLLEFAATLVPFLSIPATGFIFFGITYVSGLMFLLTLSRIFRAGGNPSSMTAEEMRAKAEEAAHEMNLRDEFMNTKDVFHKMRKDGSLDDNSRGVDIESETV